MNDRIFIEGLRFRCRIGVTGEERARRRWVRADLRLDCDLRRAGASDRLEDTVDYAGLARRIVASIRTREFCLLEALAQHVAALCLADRRVRSAGVRLEKPGAIPGCRSTAVDITRARRRSRNREQSAC